MTVTPESNLALIQQLQDLVSSAAEPPSGPEFSYPVVDQAVSSSMWKWITRGMGSGILGEGGQPYWYRNPSNANNTAQIAVSTISGEAHAMIGGYYHHLSQAVTVQLPMPASGTVTYHVALTYDPRRESDPEGPIKLETHTESLPTTFGREHIPLWSITRSANQLLTDATVQQYRPFVTPSTTYNRREHLPDPGMMLSGTTARTRLDGGMFMALQGNEVGADGESAVARWVNLQDPVWTPQVNSTYEGAGVGFAPAYGKVGREGMLRGSVRLKNGNPFSVNNNSGRGYHVMTLPAGCRPPYTWSHPVAAATATASANVIISSDGEVRVWVGGICNFVHLNGVRFPTVA